MEYVLTFRAEARDEMEDAYNWYEDQKAKLGEDFLTCVDSTLDRIEQQPESYPCCFPGFSTSCDSSVSLRDLLSNHRPPNHCDCSRSRKKRSQDLAIQKMMICFTHCHDRRWRLHIGDRFIHRELLEHFARIENWDRKAIVPTIVKLVNFYHEITTLELGFLTYFMMIQYRSILALSAVFVVPLGYSVWFSSLLLELA